MARTKGAKDRRPRRGSRPGKPAAKKTSPSQSGTVTTPTTEQTTIESGDSQFRTAVEAVLGPDSLSRGGPSPAEGAASPEQLSTGPPAAIEHDIVLGIDAWEALVEAPFRSLAIMLRMPAFEQLGKLRAKMIAQPSYPLYRHYVTQWLTDNPDDKLFVAKIMTAAALATVIQEGWMIYVGEGQRRAAVAKAVSEVHKVSVDALHTEN